MKIITKNSSHSTFIIVTKRSILKKQCLKIDNYLTWKNHIAQMISNLRGACYAVRLMVHISNINTLKSISSIA